MDRATLFEIVAAMLVVVFGVGWTCAEILIHELRKELLLEQARIAVLIEWGRR